MAAKPRPEHEISRHLGVSHERRIEWLRADTIEQHPDYQRKLNKEWARKLAEAFDAELLLPLIVSRRRDGSLWCMGGQHRLYAIVEVLGWGDQRVECDVYEGLTPEEEARFHDATARTKAHSLLERFKIRIESGDERARAVRDALGRVGLAVATNMGSSPGSVRAVRALDDIADLHGVAHLEAVLRLLHDSFGDDHHAYDASLIKGASAFLVRYGDDGDLNRAQLVERLRDRGLRALKVRADAIRAASGSASGAYTAWGKAIVGFYNAGRRTRMLGEWRENVVTPEVEARRNERFLSHGPAGFANPDNLAKAHEARRRNFASRLPRKGE